MSELDLKEQVKELYPFPAAYFEKICQCLKEKTKESREEFIRIMQEQMARSEEGITTSETIKFIIDLPPVTKKNHGRIVRRGNKPILLPSEQFIRYQNAAGAFLEPLGIGYKVNIKCLFYMPTRRIVDLVGLLQAVDDVLTHYGVITDDNSRIVAGHDGSRVLYDKEHPRTEIYIEKML